MLAVSQQLNPECEHVEGDMRTVRLGRLFDAVLIQDSIGYMTTKDDLSKAIESAFVHCQPGGAALFAPDLVRESFRPFTDCGGRDGEGQALRYLEWGWDPDPNDQTYLVEFVFLLRDRDEPPRVVQDRHTCGLFSRQDWLRIIGKAGFEARALPFEHSKLEPGTHEVFLGCKRN
jgi:hypothetical protein